MMKSQTGVPRVLALDPILPGAIVVATFLVFAGTLSFDFVYDDRLQVLQNPYILSWQYLPQYFTFSLGAASWAFGSGAGLLAACVSGAGRDFFSAFGALSL